MCIRDRESILSQSFTDFELILVNDGSTDLSGRICDECAAFDARVRVKHQTNGGRTRARHEGVKLSRGEWVTFVDSDDALATDALRMLSGRATADVDIVFGNGYTLPCMARDFIPMAEFRHRAVRGEGTIGVPWGSFYRRTLLSDYVFDLPRDIYMGEDYIYWLRMVFATDLMPESTGSIAGIFYGLSFGFAGIGSSFFGWLADRSDMQFVFQVSTLLPLMGIIAVFLPKMHKV